MYEENQEFEMSQQICPEWALMQIPADLADRVECIRFQGAGKNRLPGIHLGPDGWEYTDCVLRSEGEAAWIVGQYYPRPATDGGAQVIVVDAVTHARYQLEWVALRSARAAEHAKGPGEWFHAGWRQTGERKFRNEGAYPLAVEYTHESGKARIWINESGEWVGEDCGCPYGADVEAALRAIKEATK